jgi:hypothetical protein
VKQDIQAELNMLLKVRHFIEPEIRLREELLGVAPAEPGCCRCAVEPVSAVSSIASIPNAERFYIDCEFDGHGGPLLSIALVHEGGCSIHVQTDQRPRDPWVQENVMPIMAAHNAGTESADVPLHSVGAILRHWMDDAQHPVFVADSPVDIGRICEVLSTAEAGGWQSCGYPRMSFEVHNVDCYPTDLEGAVQHNAWWDAMALRHRLAV